MHFISRVQTMDSLLVNDAMNNKSIVFFTIVYKNYTFSPLLFANECINYLAALFKMHWLT